MAASIDFPLHRIPPSIYGSPAATIMQAFTCPHCFRPSFLPQGPSTRSLLQQPPLGHPLHSNNFGPPARQFFEPQQGASATWGVPGFPQPQPEHTFGSTYGDPTVFPKSRQSSPKSGTNNIAHVATLSRERLRPDHHESFQRATPHLRILYEEFIQNPEVVLRGSLIKETRRSAAATAAIQKLDSISGGMQSRGLQRELEDGVEAGPLGIIWERFGELWHALFVPLARSMSEQEMLDFRKGAKERLLDLVEEFAYPYGWAKLPPCYP